MALLSPSELRQLEADCAEWYEEMLDYLTEELTSEGPPYPAVERSPEELLEWWYSLEDPDVEFIRTELQGEYGPSQGEKMFQQMLDEVERAEETVLRRAEKDAKRGAI